MAALVFNVFGASVRRALHLSVLTALFLASAFGQEGLSTLRGTVTDSSGAVVPNVVVVAREVLTNFTARTVKTDGQGNYEMPAAPGPSSRTRLSFTGCGTGNECPAAPST